MAENLVDKKSRKRGANFTNFTKEKQALLPIMERYKSIVECKRTDAVSSKRKLRAWEEICRVFNAKGLSPEHRPANKIKVLWENIKRDTRRKLSTLRQETFKTGGGRNPVKEDLFCSQVREIIGNTAEPMDNIYDDDAHSMYNDEVTGSFGEMGDTQEMQGTEEEENETLSNYTDQEIDWSHWNPVMLKTQKSATLCVPSTSAVIPVQYDAPSSAATATNTEQAKEIQRLDESVAKRLKKKPYNKRCAKRSINEALIQAKLEYINIFKNQSAEKAAMEMEILKSTLLEKQLKIEILRKQLEDGK